MNKVAGIVAYVKDTAKTAAFYEKLGFSFDTRKPDHISVHLADFWLDFHPQELENKPEFQQEANLEPTGIGLFLYIKVENVDSFYKNLLAQKLTPSSQPRDWLWGNREFIIRDPDGYKLVFYTPISKT